ncbi:MAG: hypothetical protein ACREQL_12260, partial [Candidatus Binatia bacterium]
MTLRSLAIATLAALVVACAGPVDDTPATTTTTRQLTAQDLVALEATPASTPPLAHGVEPAPAPVPGLPGT